MTVTVLHCGLISGFTTKMAALAGLISLTSLSDWGIFQAVSFLWDRE